MKGSLFRQQFLATLVVALVAVLATGLIVRTLFARAFTEYLSGLPMFQGTMGRGRGARLVAGAAEQAFLGSVDRGILVAAFAAVALAGVAALIAARGLSRPLVRLTEAAQSLASGDLGHRVEAQGPAEVERLGEAFNEMAASLEEAEELRRRLVADVAHELRNPLAAARAQAEGMAEGVLAVDQARLGGLVSDVAHLSRLVEDLQELSSAEAGALRYDMAEVDLGALVMREAERARTRLHEGLVVEARVPEAAVVVRGDELRLAQVLRNLLSNALRHTETGSVTVVVEGREGLAEVRVEDTGEGIPAADLPYVFERFYRADAARARDTGGAGIGLAIARRIVRDHGGDVFARSEPGQGAVVGFTLPKAPGGAAEG